GVLRRGPGSSRLVSHAKPAGAGGHPTLRVRRARRAAGERFGDAAGQGRRQSTAPLRESWPSTQPSRPHGRPRRPSPPGRRERPGGGAPGRPGDGPGAVRRLAVAGWTAAAAAGMLWPGRALGLLDGLPLNGATEALLVGLAVPALWFLDRTVFATG